jgi:hypothetical protein
MVQAKVRDIRHRVPKNRMTGGFILIDPITNDRWARA